MGSGIGGYSSNLQTNFMGNTSSPSYNSPAPTGGGFVMHPFYDDAEVLA